MVSLPCSNTTSELDGKTMAYPFRVHMLQLQFQTLVEVMGDGSVTVNFTAPQWQLAG
jgi:hypothetical protein